MTCPGQSLPPVAIVLPCTGPVDPDTAFGRARIAALSDPRIGPAFGLLPDHRDWVEACAARPWFSEWHARTPGFSLPFVPDHCLWAPIPITVPVVPGLSPHGHFRRGVARYVRQLRLGGETPPVCFIWSGVRWKLLDGNHRYEAHVRAGRPVIGTHLAIPRSLLRE